MNYWILSEIGVFLNITLFLVCVCVCVWQGEEEGNSDNRFNKLNLIANYSALLLLEAVYIHLWAHLNHTQRSSFSL